MKADVEIIAINLINRTALTSDDTICRVETFLDEHGDEVDDPIVAVVAIGQLPDERWFTADMRCFEDTKPH